MQMIEMHFNADSVSDHRTFFVQDAREIILEIDQFQRNNIQRKTSPHVNRFIFPKSKRQMVIKIKKFRVVDQ